MRIMFAGDWHGNTDHAINVITRAAVEGVDAIVQCGDFGAWEHVAGGREYLDALEQALVAVGLEVFWVDGNHDKWSETLRRHGDVVTVEGFVECRRNLFYLPRGLRWEWDGVTFLALGGAYSVDKAHRLKEEHERWLKQVRHQSYGGPKAMPQDGMMWFPEEEITDEQEALAKEGGHVDVMVTHDKPAQSRPAWNRKAYPECLPNAQRVQRVVEATQPYLLVHGHLHFPYTDHVACEPWSDDLEHTYLTTRVVGLDADLDAAMGEMLFRPGSKWQKRYHLEDSYLIVDTSELLAEKVEDPR